MNGLGRQTAILGPTTAVTGPTSPSTITLRWLAGIITHKHSHIYNSRHRRQAKKQYKSSLPMTQWISLSGCVSGWADCLPSASSSVPAVLVFSIFRPFVFPKTAICVFRVSGTGSRACFSLSHEFNQRNIPESWTDTHTHIDTYADRHTHALKRQQVAFAVCKDTWRKRSVRNRDARHCFSARRATPQQHLTTVPSVQLCWDFANMCSPDLLTVCNGSLCSSS